jgi:hypothetical protein
MIERSAALNQRKISEKIAKMEKQKSRMSTNMNHKAFWVHNTSGEITLPNIKEAGTSKITPRH